MYLSSNYQSFCFTSLITCFYKKAKLTQIKNIPMIFCYIVYYNLKFNFAVMVIFIKSRKLCGTTTTNLIIFLLYMIEWFLRTLDSNVLICNYLRHQLKSYLVLILAFF